MWFRTTPQTLRAVEQARHRIVVEQVVEAPPDEVFGAWATLDEWPRWFREVQGGAWDTPGPHGVGSRRTVVLDTLSVREHFLAWEPGRRFAFEVTEMTLPLTSWMVEDLRVEPLPGGQSRVVWTVAYELRWWLRPLRPLVIARFAPMFRAAAAGLARHLRRAEAEGGRAATA